MCINFKNISRIIRIINFNVRYLPMRKLCGGHFGMLLLDSCVVMRRVPMIRGRVSRIFTLLSQLCSIQGATVKCSRGAEWGVWW